MANGRDGHVFKQPGQKTRKARAKARGSATNKNAAYWVLLCYEGFTYCSALAGLLTPGFDPTASPSPAFYSQVAYEVSYPVTAATLLPILTAFPNQRAGDAWASRLKGRF
jgi:hypothetical protein